MPEDKFEEISQDQYFDYFKVKDKESSLRSKA
jgi:hypothetical protein